MAFSKITMVFLLYYTRVDAAPGDDVSAIYGFMPVDCNIGSFSGGLPVYYSGEQVELLVYGSNLIKDIHVGITREKHCDYVQPSTWKVRPESHGHVAILSFIAPSADIMHFSNTQFHICLKQNSGERWMFQGAHEGISFYVCKPLLNPIMYMFIIVFCFAMSSLMSGLNIGLMTLDQNELHLLKTSGTAKEQKYAKTIIPVRRNGNYLLCSILIMATLCNSVATVSIDKFASEWFTVAITTVVIVLLCEILPQSICTYFPLSIGANTIYVTRACMVLTAPLSYPLSMVLNMMLGKELAATYTKDRLKELLKMTRLPQDEVQIISGTLDLSRKRVEEVMTLLDDVFKLPIDAVMDFDTIVLITASGFSRIPIYEGKKSNIRHVLLTKDLALVDPDDKVPVRVLVQHSNFSCSYIPVGTTLDKVLGLFKDSRGHMAFIVGGIEHDDNKERLVIGLITFEDVIEEIFQMEINDETDFFTDNRSKQKLSGEEKASDLLSLLKINIKKTSSPSENLKLAAFHFLSGVLVFSVEFISSKVLLSLLSLDIFYQAPGHKLPQDIVYVQGVPANYFVMVLEGLMELKIGSEDLRFEVGPFRYFGVEALKRITLSQTEVSFVPDYTLQAIKKTLYLKISREQYDAAVLATKYERFKEFPDISSTSSIFKFFKQIIGSDPDENKLDVRN